ncbi:FUN14 domain-containing protein 1-like [Rhynchophorus ferrugineus]|uniref:FUN14 domain-containing protein 1-like n=1 Tax=Rhynchophorus ferrugineus TaxID=354439 RepID=UPI003FCCEC50
MHDKISLINKSPEDMANTNGAALPRPEVGYINTLARNIYEEIRKLSSNRQLFIGASSGWVSGVFTMKIGRILAAALGGGLILLQLANEAGYISINWSQLKKVDKNMNQKDHKKKDELSLNLIRNLAGWTQQIINFAVENPEISTGFVGGFFLGLISV